MDNVVPLMQPGPGERLARFVGDRVRFSVEVPGPNREGPGWRALLRTNLGRGRQLRREILEAHTHGLPLAGASWRDLPMEKQAVGWSLELPLTEVGFFKAKAYLVDSKGWQHWPSGPDIGISVHPDAYRTANTIYCAFVRLFGPDKAKQRAEIEARDASFIALDKEGYTVIPPSGKLRDLTRELPHIFATLGCRILHLLPVNPTPTTYARFGRFGSPYAALDLTAIDPELVVFDKRTTAVDQFRELTYAAHSHGGRVFLDMVINHTGWGSTLLDGHPDWFLRNPDGSFASPGAWGVTWEDLVELRHKNVQLWDLIAEAFLTWCHRGVDGFRCDAGYKVPTAAWQYIISRVQEEYPNTIFLLEGLGGAWETTETLLTEGEMHWAYSELFQNYSGPEIASYLDYSLRQSERVGLFVHYSETHDNDRLAKRGRAWSLLRNRLCALASVSGGFAFTCGVEWLASEKIRVHGSTGLAWGQPANVVSELARLNRLLSENPCFFDAAKLTRVSQKESPVYALWRVSQEGLDRVLVLINSEPEKANTFALEDQFLRAEHDAGGGGSKQPPPRSLSAWADLLGQALPTIRREGTKTVFELPPAGAYCLALSPRPEGVSGDSYRRQRQQAAWALLAINQVVPAERIRAFDWQAAAAAVERSPADFLAAVANLPPDKGDLDVGTLFSPQACPHFPRVVRWSRIDLRRITPVPEQHWLLLEDEAPFRAFLTPGENAEATGTHVESIPAGPKHIACFPPRDVAGDCRLLVERYAESERNLEAQIRFLGKAQPPRVKDSNITLLTNGRGGMARMCVDLGRVTSKYDCVLAANLHPTLPVDRHVLIKRLRVWVNADGFISPLEFRSLKSFHAGPPALWDFVANAGDGRSVQIRLRAEMLEGKNTVRFKFTRPTAAHALGKQLPAKADVRLTLRLDLEDRNFHAETRRNGGADYHFATHIQPVRPPGARDASVFSGFKFTPAADRQLLVLASSGIYHPQPEWSENLPHPIEASRGQQASGDGYSPGWFELPLPKGASVEVVATAELNEFAALESGAQEVEYEQPVVKEIAPLEGETLEQKLVRAIRAFVVRRGDGKTVIAGYPWFLDWGRDTFICARGLLAAGMTDEVRQIVLTFARFEEDGTLPNTIFGEDASNRDTSDAPLWFGLVCEELAASLGPVHHVELSSGRSLLDVLRSIAFNYQRGTRNGIRVDPQSGLVWSPSHFTWMDTNYPAGTPRQGYPVEIQALWIRLLQYLARVAESGERGQWKAAAEKAARSVEDLFWLPQNGWYADVVEAQAGQPAARGTPQDALRSNCLFLPALGIAQGERAQSCTMAALRYLVVPGALRSLAPLPVSHPLPVIGNNGQLLNDPRAPYWGRYEGDEDTRRKPAYHNGTAWTWTFPIFCEALAKAWGFSPESVAAAGSYLGSMESLMSGGCLGHIPEVLDGDQPHQPRGCDAQAWGATEALRVLKLLQSKPA